MNHLIISLLIFLGVGALVTYAVYRKNKGNPKLPIKIAACIFGTLLLVQFGMYVSVRQNARYDFKTELRKFEASKTVVLINGQDKGLNPEEVISQLLLVGNLQDHHSGPKTAYKFSLNDGKQLMEFVLSRDSEYQAEYWIDVNDRNIGKIRTQLFKALK